MKLPSRQHIPTKRPAENTSHTSVVRHFLMIHESFSWGVKLFSFSRCSPVIDSSGGQGTIAELFQTLQTPNALKSVKSNAVSSRIHVKPRSSLPSSTTAHLNDQRHIVDSRPNQSINRCQSARLPLYTDTNTTNTANAVAQFRHFSRQPRQVTLTLFEKGSLPRTPKLTGEIFFFSPVGRPSYELRLPRSACRCWAVSGACSPTLRPPAEAS